MVMWIESCEYEYVSRMIHSNGKVMRINMYTYQRVLLVVDINIMNEL